MDENKYYTPSIEEFHIGFECEYKAPNKNWTKIKMAEIVDIYNVGLRVGFTEDSCPIRVKLLSKEDIESLGFTLILEDSLAISYLVDVEKDIQLTLIKPHGPVSCCGCKNCGVPHICISRGEVYEKDSYSLFEGKVKNKTELQQVLSMVL